MNTKKNSLFELKRKNCISANRILECGRMDKQACVSSWTLVLTWLSTLKQIEQVAEKLHN